MIPQTPRYYILKQRPWIGNVYIPGKEVISDGEWLLRLPPWRLMDSCFIGTPIDWREHKSLAESWNSRILAFSPTFYGSKPDFSPVLGDNKHVCSARMQNILISFTPSGIEFLPFRVRNSRGRDITDGYSLMHYLCWVDAIDRRRSVLADDQIEWPTLRDRGVFYLDRLVLDGRKMTQPVCRVVGSSQHFYREDVVQALEQAGIDGTVWEPVEVL